jgi:nucleotide-binding universal stress UspA family protein
MYKKILVPLDLSEYSLKALIHAEQLARLSGAELVLLHTIHYVTVYTWDGPAGTRDEGCISEEQKEIADKFLSNKSEELKKKGIIASYAVGEGKDNAEKILDFIEENDDIDLVVLMTHGRSGIKRFVMGDVAEKVVRGHSRVPILLITSRAAEKIQ